MTSTLESLGLTYRSLDGTTRTRHAAELGDPFALWKMAQAELARADGDPWTARAWLDRAAQRDFRLALRSLAELHVSGRLGGVDYAVANGLWRRAARRGCADSALRLAISLARGRSMAPDMTEAQDFLELAALNGSAEAACQLAHVQANGQLFPDDKGEALRRLFGRSRTDPAASYAVGMCLIHGIGLRRDHDHAREYLRLAIAAGHADAACELATCLLCCSEDVAGHQEAVHILRRFAETGHATSCVKLAHVYVYGRGVPTDLKQAEHWLRKGAATGAPLARFHLADLLLGEAPTRETILWAAGEFEHLAYSYGLNEAVRALGQVAFCFENDVSPLLMEQWLTHSAPLGDVQQFIILAELFLGQRPAGDAILDRTRGLFWLQAAAETDNVNAMRRLAFELLRGHPSARDPAGGVALLTSAATLGDVDAVTVLA